MPLFYVPVVIVVDALTKEEAGSRADQIMDGVNTLNPADYQGYQYIENLEAAQASDTWVTDDDELFIGNTGGHTPMLESK